MRIEQLGIPGCYEVMAPVMADERGSFVKTFHADIFREHGLPLEWREEYYSTSHRNVVRGMHFQTPPMDHHKMVYCLQGEVEDVVLDLRRGSPTYGQSMAFTLSPGNGRILVLPAGIAHGFLALQDNTIMQYKVTSVYSAANDQGVRWDSFGHRWRLDGPVILSGRDQRHPALADFNSPFEFRAAP